MRISIITFHDTFNFGATLQCAALTRYLTARNHEVTVLNYMPDYVRMKKSCLKEFYSIRNRRGLGAKGKSLFKSFYYAFHFPVFSRRNKNYEIFLHKNLRLSDPYYTYEDLRKCDPADLYICGSDQIWNPNLTGGQFDKAYFLDFVENNKIAYGVSTGEADLPGHKTELLGLTESFDRISVREKKTAEELSAVLERDVEVVLDCTLLLNEEDYAGMEVETKAGAPYLLFYNVSVSSLAAKAAVEIARQKGLKIIDVSPSPFVKVPGAEKIGDIGPGEFLSYVKGADFVVTNSFHGTVFSIIYKKLFYSIPHKTRSGRTESLLNMLGLSGRLVTKMEDVADETIDYRTVYELLDAERIKSCSYLEVQ